MTTTKQRMLVLLALVVMEIASWSMSKMVGNPFVPQHARDCRELTLKSDGTYASVPVPCPQQEKKQTPSRSRRNP